VKEYLDYASKKYYEGEPVISDEAFDRLAEKFNYSRVGYSQGDDSFKHPFRMYSLQKFYVGDKLKTLPPPLIITPKLDGAAISVTYIQGNLSMALSRGDGILGKDITQNIKRLNIPKRIENRRDLVQITGEIVAPKSIENSRNYAAGALGLKDPEEFAARELTFIAYGLEPWHNKNYVEDLLYLKSQGFNIVTESNWDQFPHDGMVLRTDSYEEFFAHGYTSKHPRGAYALKERKQGVITTLRKVIWQVGKSGVVSPVAILDPIVIDGATVSRATLHNPKYIKDLNLEIGCQVEVIRAGEIIPRVVGRVD
jgi:DNA ligase (NAD+)